MSLEIYNISQGFLEINPISHKSGVKQVKKCASLSISTTTTSQPNIWLETYIKACQWTQAQFLRYMTRLLFSLLFFGMSAMIGKIVTMVFVIPRVNVNTAPATDLVLSSFQHSIPQAFKVTEFVTSLMVGMLIAISLLHTKERTSIIPRFLFISATLINLRTFCISITTFSIPSRELSVKCSNLQQLSTEMLWWKSINFFEFSETCGDYVFSGHATALVVSAWFVWYYGRSLSFLTSITLKKIMNFVMLCIVLLGLMCILFAKEHYTVDVVLGTVISIAWCALYHMMLENYRNRVLSNVNKESKQRLDKVEEDCEERFDVCNISSIIYWWFTIFDSANNDETVNNTSSNETNV